MRHELITVAQCADLSGLGWGEVVLGATPSRMHDALFDSYLLHREKGWDELRDMIVADIRIALDLGAKERAADLFFVLRRLMSQPPTGKSQAVGFECPGVTRWRTGRHGQSAAENNVVFLDVVRSSRAAVGGGR